MLPQPSEATRVMWYATVGIVIAVVSAGALAGHLLKIEPLTNFGGEVSMAINTALCLLLCGSAWITHAADLHHLSRDKEQPESHG